MEVIIDSNIEIPAQETRGRWKKAHAKYPMSKLNVKDSFWVPKAQGPSMRCTASRFKRQNPGWNYTVRSEQNAGEDGCRIWRTA
jgi:hypothetical protein